ncbi:MAG: SIR2 family protein [Deltaproteobacteria bacterium]|nr:SIR2 family protein [Deltaproteobacteria bacterium]
MKNNNNFDAEKNKLFIGNSDKLSEWLKIDEKNQEKAIERIKLLIKNYLELDNVSFLFGSGSSIHLGAVSIRNFPLEVEEYIKSKDIGKNEGIDKEFKNTIKALQKSNSPKEEKEKGKENEIIRVKESKDIATKYEKVLNYLIAKDYTLDEENAKRTDKIKELILTIKEGLFSVCNIANRKIPDDKVKEEYSDLVKDNKYHFHEKFLKALLQRPLNLKRANIFTLNYDLAFEYAFDKLGIYYIDGFAGFHKRYFKPETFEYDMFYPGYTTSGKVQRIEKVVRYFKLHGSISWVNSEKRDANNLYGIEELPLPLIEKLEKKGEIIIYPSAVKKSYTLDFPYSELFRQFAATITHSQSVLITVGYSFADEHINDIIFQALSNPSFTLIILAYSSDPNIERIKKLNDSRIIILEGEFLGDFLIFSDKIMPDFYNIKSREKVAKILNEYFDNNQQKQEDETEV